MQAQRIDGVSRTSSSQISENDLINENLLPQSGSGCLEGRTLKIKCSDMYLCRKVNQIFENYRCIILTCCGVVGIGSLFGALGCLAVGGGDPNNEALYKATLVQGIIGISFGLGMCVHLCCFMDPNDIH